MKCLRRDIYSFIHNIVLGATWFGTIYGGSGEGLRKDLGKEIGSSRSNAHKTSRSDL
jgi:hypothetical protein